MTVRALSLLIGVSLALMSCQAPVRQVSGNFHVENTRAADGDYVVRLTDTVGFGSHSDDKPNRSATVLSLMKHACPAGRVVRESVNKDEKLETVYSIYVKCKG